LFAGCGPDSGTIGKPFNRDAGPDFSNLGVMCVHPPPDTDGDGISDHSEGADESPPRDTDHDGVPDFMDPDSDNDGIPDAIEGRNGNPCTPPVDTDGDGKPDFQDWDSDSPTDSTVPDKEEAGPDPTNPVDTDGDGLPDYADLDNDGDGITDQFELTGDGMAVAATTRASAPDTDQDGIPDYLDTDSDGDTILDADEGLVDTDGDLTPNYRDLDSDGDCVPDIIEAGDTDPKTRPVDTDMDGAPDFEDRDTDNDGLTDDKEDKNCNGVVDACETDRLKTDTDGDGVNDLIEVQDCAVKSVAVQMAEMCQCDGSNPNASPLTHGDFVFVVDYMMPPVPQLETLNLSTDVSQADVVFSLDSTGSMGQALHNLAVNLSGLVPKAQARVKSLAMGVVDFKDFGDTYVVNYDYRVTTVNTMPGIMAVQNVLSGLAAGGGGDYPEAGWEALYAIAGGPAINVAGYSSTLPLNIAPNPIPAGESQGSVGGAAFRPGSVPIVVTATDASWHDAPNVAASGENGIADYGAAENGVPSRASAISRLQALNAHVMALAGINGGAEPGGNPKGHGQQVALDTGAVVSPADFSDPVTGARPAGCSVLQCCTGISGAGEAPLASGLCPLSYTFDDTNGNGVSDSVVSGIVALANGLKFDIHVVAADVDPGTVDNFIAKLVPNLSGVAGAAMCITMTPSPLQDNFTGPKALPGPDATLDTFPGIGGGKQICFDVTPRENTTVMNTEEPQFFRAQLQVKGVNGASTVNLGTPRDVFFLVPPVIKNGPIN
jgi:hypothetical protein